MHNTLGKKGENLAVEYLKNLSYQIIGRNIHLSNKGELDIIAKKDNILHFIEVKTRRITEINDFYDLSELLSYKKKQHLRKSVELYLNSSLLIEDYQIDLLVVIFNKNHVSYYFYEAIDLEE